MLTTLLISTSEPNPRSCGSSVMNVAIPVFQIANEIKRKFLSSYGLTADNWEILSILKYFCISVSVAPIVLLDSWNTNPSVGGLAVIG